MEPDAGGALPSLARLDARAISGFDCQCSPLDSLPPSWIADPRPSNLLQANTMEVIDCAVCEVTKCSTAEIQWKTF
jgi:hypothetical protein